MTKAELAAKRDATYIPPPEKRCETCEHSNYFSNLCILVKIRNKVETKDIHPFGVCDLWEPRT